MSSNLGLGWIKPEKYSFNSLLLMERFQLYYALGKTKPEFTSAMGIALAANPAVAWYIKHRCPERSNVVDELLATVPKVTDEKELRDAEVYVLASLEDFVTYTTPEVMAKACDFIYGWDEQRLFELEDIEGKTVLDIGAGSGRLAFAAAKKATMVYAIEPVATLREFMRNEIARLGITNIRVLDGFMMSLPYPDAIFDIVLSGHVVGDHIDEELAEMARVTKPKGWMLNVPGDQRFAILPFKELTERGFEEIHYVGCFGKDVYIHRKQKS